MKTLVIFGSKSDKEVYDNITEKLKEKNVDYKLRIASAHKTPKLVDEIMKEDWQLIIAGAGLAAHLPGVIAAKKTCPVIGVPCSGAYDGLDAFLSIAQMPPGIPVLAVGVSKADEAANAAAKIAKGFSEVNIVGENAKAAKVLGELGVGYTEAEELEGDKVNIAFVKLGEKIKSSEELVIYCPTAEKTSAHDAAEAMKMARSGLWVGVNAAENAAVAAAEIIGKKKLDAYREKIAQKVIDSDREERK